MSAHAGANVIVCRARGAMNGRLQNCAYVCVCLCSARMAGQGSPGISPFMVLFGLRAIVLFSHTSFFLSQLPQQEQKAPTARDVAPLQGAHASK